jgi:S1-C subfamily serine protease
LSIRKGPIVSDDWYVRSQNKVHGPLTLEALQRAASAGRISRDTLIRQGLRGAWMPAKQLKSLAFGPPPLPSPSRTADPILLQPVKPGPKMTTPMILAVAGFGGVSVLAAAVLVAFELGRRQTVADAEPPHANAAAAVQPLPDPAGRSVKPNAPAQQQVPVAKIDRVAEIGPNKSPASPKTIDLPKQIAAADPIQPPVAGLAKKASPDIKASPVVNPGLGNKANPAKQPEAPLPVAKAGPKAIVPVPPLPAPAVPLPVALAKPPQVKPPVIVKVPATDAALRALETASTHLASAKDVIAHYDDFALRHTMTAAQQATFDAARKVWEGRAAQDLVRLGTKWVTPAELTKAQETATQLVEQAYEMTRVLNFAAARKALEKASSLDQNSIAADFTLGLLNSITPPDVRHPPTAIKHFRTVLRRSPAYVPALNNLALVEIRDTKYADAIHHLKEAAEKSPKSLEITQNLGRFVSEARLGKIHPSATLLAEATNVYSKVVAAKRGSPATERAGWLYIPFVAPKKERESLVSIRPNAGGASIRDYAEGTGFVVAPQYVLTCRHVVDDLRMGQADRVEIIDPQDAKHEHRLFTTVVATCPDDDLALLKCDTLQAAALPLASALPQRGAEILVIGYPGGSAFGYGLKTTRGIVAALPGAVSRSPFDPPWSDRSHDILYDAATSHGASGAAVFEKHGNVLAVHAHGLQPGNDPSNAKYAGGVPATSAIAFIRNSLPSFDPHTANNAGLEWTAVDEKVSPSLVLIVVGHFQLPIVVPAPQQQQQQKADDIFDDHYCSACNGRAKIRCPHCHRGSVSDDLTVRNVTRSPLGTLTTVDTMAVQRKCTFCGGTGFIHCPHCADGIDHGSVDQGGINRSRTAPTRGVRGRP